MEENFLIYLSDKYGIDKNTVLKEWEKWNEDSKKNEDDIADGKDKYNKCIYKYSRAPHKGKICNASIRKKDSVYCSKHYRYGQKKEEKIEEKIKKKDDEKDDEKEEKGDEKKDKKKMMIARRDPVINKFVHFATKFVFVSKDDPTVFSKYIDGELLPLTEEDILLCKKYNLKYVREEKKDEMKDEKDENL